MLQTKTISTPSDSVQKKQRYVFVLQLHSGEYVIGSSEKPGYRIADINYGLNSNIPYSLQVNRIIGIKECTENRNQLTVYNHFVERYGVEKVIPVWRVNSPHDIKWLHRLHKNGS